MTEIIDGNEVAAEIRSDLSTAVDQLRAAGVEPCFGTILMSPDPAAETYVSMKQNDCEEVGIETRDVELATDEPAEKLFAAIDEFNEDPDVHGILVQSPTPEHVDEEAVLERIDPRKDVDGFHPENVGKLVAGTPRFKPCTPHGIQKLLAHTGIDTEGKDAVVVGRSRIVGKPMANLFIRKEEGGNATTTVCHSRTENLAEKTQNADILVVAAGRPEFVDGSMVGDGAVVIDVGINRVDADTEKGYELVGDVAFESAKEKASAITPVPGGVGPMTRAMLLYNVIKAAGQQEDVDVDLP